MAAQTENIHNHNSSFFLGFENGTKVHARLRPKNPNSYDHKMNPYAYEIGGITYTTNKTHLLACQKLRINLSSDDANPAFIHSRQSTKGNRVVTSSNMTYAEALSYFFQDTTISEEVDLHMEEITISIKMIFKQNSTIFFTTDSLKHFAMNLISKGSLINS